MTDSPDRPQIDVTRRGGHARIRFMAEHLAGDEFVTELRNTLDRITQQLPGAQIEIEMQNVAYLSSAVLGELTAALRQLKRAGGQMRLLQPTPEVKEILLITKLDELVQETDSTG
jgi:anti-anti-sigma factor